MAVARRAGIAPYGLAPARPAPAPPDGRLLLRQHVAAVELLQQRHHHTHGALGGRVVQVLLCTWRHARGGRG